MARTDSAAADSFVAEDPAYWMSAETSPRRVRMIFGEQTVAESRSPMLFRERGRTPVYYFRRGEVRLDLLVPSEETAEDPNKGAAQYFDVAVGERVARQGAYSYSQPHVQWPDRPEFLGFVWDKMDAIYEEEERVYKHARDPYHRVDAMPSSRHVRVLVGDQTIAETRNPHLLFETSHPTRFYIAQEDLRLDLLEATDLHTRCPYKGEASYWKLASGGEEIAWAYLDPLPECPKIKGLIAFYNERVDEIWVDGELEAKPPKRWYANARP